MRRFLRIIWLLLCLLLAARGSAAAVLPITDARWHDHPVAMGALINQSPVVGLHDEAAVQGAPERTAADGSSRGSLPEPHHHSCHQLCNMLAAAVTAPLPVPLPLSTAAPVPALQVFSSVVSSPPVPPPRMRPRADRAFCL
jgi:hypothetical protein